jgi:hypothetical protein
MLAGRSSIPLPAESKPHRQTFRIRRLEMTTTIARDHYNPTQEKDRLALEHEKGQYTLWQMLGI